MKLDSLNSNHSGQSHNQQSASFDAALKNSARHYKNDNRSSAAKTDELFNSGADRNGNGKLEAKELADALGISVKEAQQIIKRFDKDGDGALNRNETKGFFDTLFIFLETSAVINSLHNAWEGFPSNEDDREFLRAMITNYLRYSNNDDIFNRLKLFRI